MIVLLLRRTRAGALKLLLNGVMLATFRRKNHFLENGPGELVCVSPRNRKPRRGLSAGVQEKSRVQALEKSWQLLCHRGSNVDEVIGDNTKSDPSRHARLIFVS